MESSLLQDLLLKLEITNYVCISLITLFIIWIVFIIWVVFNIYIKDNINLNLSNLLDVNVNNKLQIYINKIMSLNKKMNTIYIRIILITLIIGLYFLFMLVIYYI